MELRFLKLSEPNMHSLMCAERHDCFIEVDYVQHMIFLLCCFKGKISFGKLQKSVSDIFFLYLQLLILIVLPLAGSQCFKRTVILSKVAIILVHCKPTFLNH